jgi:hypothetical protein
MRGRPKTSTATKQRVLKLAEKIDCRADATVVAMMSHREHV